MTFETITVDTYPIRYAANENPSVWVESTHPTAGTPGQEIACYFETDGNGNELHVSIVNHAGRQTPCAKCEVVGPKYDQRKNMHFFASNVTEAHVYALRWIEWAKTYEFTLDGEDPFPTN
jgi:hypothetical protein